MSYMVFLISFFGFVNSFIAMIYLGGRDGVAFSFIWFVISAGFSAFGIAQFIVEMVDLLRI